MKPNSTNKKRTTTGAAEGGDQVGTLEGDNAIYGRAAILELLKHMNEKLKNKEFNPSLSEFIRLVQLEREMADEEPAREIRVSWSDLKTESGIEQ